MKHLKVVQIAEELRELRGKIAAEKEKIRPLEEQERELTDMLIKSLKQQALKNLKLDSGEVFTRAQRSSIKVTDPEKAFEWAQEHDSLTIDKTKAAKILRREMSMPEGFEEAVTEYLSVRKDMEL